MLRKQVHPWCPESALLFNVLTQAIEDLADAAGVVQTRAYNYILARATTTSCARCWG